MSFETHCLTIVHYSTFSMPGVSVSIGSCPRVTAYPMAECASASDYVSFLMHSPSADLSAAQTKLLHNLIAEVMGLNLASFDGRRANADEVVFTSQYGAVKTVVSYDSIADQLLGSCTSAHYAWSLASAIPTKTHAKTHEAACAARDLVPVRQTTKTPHSRQDKATTQGGEKRRKL